MYNALWIVGVLCIPLMFAVVGCMDDPAEHEIHFEDDEDGD